MMYYTIEEIEKIERPYKKGYKTVIVKDVINNIAFFDFRETPQSKEIKELIQKLSDTDYKAIKYAEGQISEEEYQPIKEERQAWRDRINELEELMVESEVE